MVRGEVRLRFFCDIDCGYSLEPHRRGGSNEYPQSMFFLIKIRKNNVYPCRPEFYYIKVGFNGVKIIKACFHDGLNTVERDVKKKHTKKNIKSSPSSSSLSSLSIYVK